MREYDYAFYTESADYLLSRIPRRPEVGLILGTALGSLAEGVEEAVVIPYAEVPNFPVSTVDSHVGCFVFGTLEGKYVAVMSGRFHYYEGYEFRQLSAPIRVFKLLGVKTAIVTNAAGAVNLSYEPGDVMVIEDHINFHGASPTRGPNVKEFGPRFFDTDEMYTTALRTLALESAERRGLMEHVHEGVYFYYPGPQFETKAEVRAIRNMGGDATGMSTVTDALTAAHCSLPLLGLSLMTNMATGASKSGERPASEFDMSAVETGAGRMEEIIRDVIRHL